jgi:hypothetical protein
MFGSTEEIILPKAIEPVRKVKNLMENIPIYSLNKPIKHIDPIQRFKPPYIPAISEEPISDVTCKPTASVKPESIIAQAPIAKYVSPIKTK